jgi:predicted KAP-like P-loop ATPase
VEEGGTVIDADKPLADPKDDELGYAPFAKHLAAALAQLKARRGIVVGLHGPWGSGKSSTVGFVKHYLDQISKEKRPLVVEFNPWWFSGSDEDLARRFFYQLSARFSKWKEFSKKLGNVLADYGDLVGELPLPGADAGSKALKKLRSGRKDIVQVKAEIEKLLEKQDRLIIVVVDDVDRLQAAEVRSLFRVIKAVADFPNVAYLIVFDQDVIVRSLEDAQHGLPGAAYLEKIVQVPFALPLPDKPTLRRLLFSRLDKVLADTPDEDFDQKRWANVYIKGVDWLIDSPRAVIRLVNSLSVTYPALKGEVNPVDFIALETLRVFRSGLYELIRSSPDRFAGAAEVGSNSSEYARKEFEKFHAGWLESVPENEREQTKQLVSELFPRLDSIWDNRYWGSDWSKQWRRQQRVAHPDCLPTYFRLAVPAGGISAAEIKHVLAMTSDGAALREKLRQLAHEKGPDGTSRARSLLDRLTDHVDGPQLTDEQAKSLAHAILDVSDDLMIPDDVKPGLFAIDNRYYVGWVVRPLLLRLGAREN